MSSRSRSPSPPTKARSESRSRSPRPSRSRTRSPAGSSPERYRSRRSPGESRSRSRSRRSRSEGTPEMTRVEGDRENPEISNCLGVFGLNFNTTERDLEKEFSKHGTLEKVQVVLDGPSKRSRGFAFIYFVEPGDATRARDALNGTEISGFKIRVDYSITKTPHKPTPGVYFHHGHATRPGFRGERGGGAGGDSRDGEGTKEEEDMKEGLGAGEEEGGEDITRTEESERGVTTPENALLATNLEATGTSDTRGTTRGLLPPTTRRVGNIGKINIIRTDTTRTGRGTTRKGNTGTTRGRSTTTSTRNTSVTGTTSVSASPGPTTTSTPSQGHLVILGNTPTAPGGVPALAPSLRGNDLIKGLVPRLLGVCHRRNTRRPKQ